MQPACLLNAAQVTKRYTEPCQVPQDIRHGCIDYGLSPLYVRKCRVFCGRLVSPAFRLNANTS